MSTRARKTSEAEPSETRPPLFERVLFVVLVAVLCARPLFSESFERIAFSFLPAEALGGTTPATTVWLDGILLVASLVVLVCRWRSPQRLHPLSVGLLVLLIAVLVSVAAAHDKRLAANAGAHLFVMVLAGIALVHVMRARWMAHVLIAAVLAGAVANAGKCITQWAYEFDDTLEYWQEQKAGLADRSHDLDSPAVINYERRLRSGEAYGLLSHPNVTASYLAMCLLVVVGVLIGLRRTPGLSRDQSAVATLVAALLALALGVGLCLTGSVGGAVAAGLGGLLLFAIGLLRGWVARHTRAVFALLTAGYVALIGAGVGYGLWRGTLPHTSLAFRWQYWRAAAQTVCDTPLTGIGRENFRAAYLLHKSPESTEEVGNPHNLWLTLLVELGPLGLIAGVLLIASVIVVALRALAGKRETADWGAGQDEGPPARAGVGMLVAVALGVLVAQAIFSAEPFDAPGILPLWLVLVAGVWSVAFIATYLLILHVQTSDGRPSPHPPPERGRRVDRLPRAMYWVAAGLIAALSVALIHNLIGFSLFTPAGLAVFVALAASAAGRPMEQWAATPLPAPQSGARLRRVLPAVAGVLLLTTYVSAIALPTIRTQARLQRIQTALQTAPDRASVDAALRQGLDALEVDPWDADLPLTLGQTTFGLAMHAQLSHDVRRRWVDLAGRYAAVAWQRNPHSFAACRLRAKISAARAEAAGSQGLLRMAAREWDTAISLCPADPRAHISAGGAWFELWERTGSAAEARRACEHLKAAVAIDATRLPEVAVKLRPAELKRVAEQLDALRAAGVHTDHD